MKNVVLGAIVVGLVGFTAFRIQSKIETSAAVQARAAEVVVPPVTAAKAEMRAISPKVVLTGAIRPANEVDVVSRTSGRVVSVSKRVGDSVRAGEVLAMVEQDVALLQVRQASAALEAAQANLMNAQRNAESAEALAKDANIPDVQLVGSRAGLKAAQAQVRSTEVALELAKNTLENTRITSPISGVVTRKNVNVGAMVSPGGAGPSAILFQVQDTSRLKLEATVEERELQFVKIGAPVKIRVDAWEGETFGGKVSALSPSLDAVSRRAFVEVEVEPVQGKLRPNMFAQGELVQEGLRQVLAIPRTALVRGKEVPTVFLLKDSSVESKEIRLGASDGQYVAVLEGVQEGEAVVTSGQSRLSEGLKVVVMNQTTEAPKAAQAPAQAASSEGGAQ